MRNAKIEAFEKNEQVSQKLGAENLSSEINFHCRSLNTRYDQEFRYLSDYQILEINQNKNLDIEFNSILEVTDLAAFVFTGGEAVREMLAGAASKREVVADKKAKFQESLHNIVMERDITPDKLKNASTLQFELPKFSSYDCKMDFYTFKSEFQKLVEPTVQRKYWADYLNAIILLVQPLHSLKRKVTIPKFGMGFLSHLAMQGFCCKINWVIWTR